MDHDVTTGGVETVGQRHAEPNVMLSADPSALETREDGHNVSSYQTITDTPHDYYYDDDTMRYDMAEQCLML